jgi:hypothetical protein
MDHLLLGGNTSLRRDRWSTVVLALNLAAAVKLVCKLID